MQQVTNCLHVPIHWHILAKISKKFCNDNINIMIFYFIVIGMPVMLPNTNNQMSIQTLS
jgi:hypothetical protein